MYNILYHFLEKELFMKNDNFGYDQYRAGAEGGDFFNGAPRPEEDISGVVENLSKPRTMIYSILSLVLGILSLVLCCCGGWGNNNGGCGCDNGCGSCC